jgi:uncharacterized membrane protein YhaH (DUF805 family)
MAFAAVGLVSGVASLALLLALIPFVGVVILLVLLLFDSTPDNQYGPSPKAGAQPAY